MPEENDLRFLILMFGFHEEERIEGRTRIQKEVCLLKYKYKFPFTFNYKSYYYGPYSEELSDTIDTLVGVKLLKETPITLGFSVFRYDYSLTKEGSQLFKKIKDRLTEEHNESYVLNLKSNVNELEKVKTYDLVQLAKKETGLESISS